MTKSTKLFLGLGILGMLLLAAAIIIIPTLFVPHHRPPHSPNSRCANNLKSLYNGLFIYQAEYGEYPDGQGSALWQTIRTKTDILKNMDNVFVCPFTKKQPQPGICHYRGPNYPVTDEVDGKTPLGADLPNNHPDGTIHVLYINGMVELVKPGTPEWERAEKYLTK